MKKMLYRAAMVMATALAGAFCLTVASVVFPAPDTAFAETSGVPTTISQWFATTGLQMVEQNESSNTMNYPAGSSIGHIVPNYTWNKAYLTSDDPMSAQLTASGVWSAAVLSNGIAVGTVTAYLANGSVQGGLDTNWVAGQLAQTLPQGARFLNDERNGVFVVDARTVKQPKHIVDQGTPHHLTDSDMTTTTTKIFQAAINKQNSDGAHVNPGSLGGGGIDLASFIADPHQQPSSALVGSPAVPFAAVGGLGLLFVIGVFLSRSFRKRRK